MLLNLKIFEIVNNKLLIIFFLLIKINLFAQFLNPKEVSLIKNFNQKYLKTNLKVFDFSQSNNGEVYIATKESLLTFDGFTWNKFSEKYKTDLRGVLYVNEQEIYTSGHRGFGVWSKNEFGQLIYKSLFFKTPTKEAPLLPVFKNITKHNNRIYFQSFQQIYVYNQLNESIEIIYANKGFGEMFSLNDKLYVQDSYLGLFEIKENQKILVKGSENNNLLITNIFHKKNEILLATRNNGFWKIEANKLTKKDWTVNSLFEKKFITDIQNYDENTFLVGTLRDGVYLMSKQGDIITHINKEKGIENNSIRKVFIDNNKNIWIATEAGLSYLEFSNLKFIWDSRSEFGTVYSSLLKDSILYLGTNQGLFKKNIQKFNSKPILIDNSVEQIWQIYEYENQILIGSHKGVFKLKNNKLQTIHIEGGAWTFKIHPIHKDIMYVGFYSGIAVFKKIGENWKFVKKFTEFADSSRFIEFDSKNQIWVSHPEKGYYRLNLSKDGLNLIEVDFYGTSNPSVETNAYFTKIDGNLVFYNPKGFFLYNAIDNTFTKAIYPYEIFKGLKNIYQIQQDDNLFWYATDNSIGYIERKLGTFKKTQSPFYSIWEKNLKDFVKFTKINKNIYGINLNDGIAFYTYKEKNTYSKAQTPVIKSIEAISAKDTINLSIEKPTLTIPYQNNYIKVVVALPNLPYGSSRIIQYRLKGLQEDWLQTEEISEINFTGLRPNDYELEIRNIIDLDKTSTSTFVSFSIIHPWYFNSTAKITYILCFIFLFYGYNLYLKKKNDKYISKLKQIEQQRRERQKEKFELEKLSSDKELLLLKEENLNLEIKKKNAALASSTLNNIKKNELLTDLINDIKSIDEKLVNSTLHYPIRKVVKKINNHLVDKEDWLTFQLHFSNSHSQFFENLREKHPNLSSNEIKLSAYLKLNLSSKEIASLMNVAITSVEQSRYRLRKKFNLDKEENLVNYIQKF
ncbi:hypothetical protein [Polaribacter sp.]|uniref:hypothetical protein n=1 Tax=Polaribacter sp. TaxID=1920175 RepID=UPI003F6D0652